MSEEEIIENLNDLLEHNYLEDVCYLREENDYVVYNNAIQGLLDLYQKEKEKNKELTEGLKYRVNYCNLLEKELYGNGINYNMELTKIEEKYLKELLERR